MGEISRQEEPDMYRDNLAGEIKETPKERRKGILESAKGTPEYRNARTRKTEEIREAEIKRDKELTSEIGIINNRPMGEQTERSVFNDPELKNKDNLTYIDVKEYVLTDRQELSEVSKEIENIIDMPISTDQTKALMAMRMEDLILTASKMAFGKQNETSEKILALKREESEMRPNNFVSEFWKKLFPKHQELQRMEQIKQEIKALQDEMNKPQLFESGKVYEIEPQTAGRMLLRRNADTFLIYIDEKGEKRGLRLNVIQLDLARRGVFYKGEPTNNRYDVRHPGWEQAAYPRSPLEFYREHMREWLGKSLEEAKKILVELSKKVR